MGTLSNSEKYVGNVSRRQRAKERTSIDIQLAAVAEARRLAQDRFDAEMKAIDNHERDILGLVTQ